MAEPVPPEAALHWAQHFRALDEQGQLWCILCGHRPGQLPHLCCGVCIARIRQGLPLVPAANDGGDR
jgi:hypothetical protein